MNVLSTYNLSKTYKDFFAVVDVNMNIKSGEIYGLIGRNGAGKTTLMKMITGLVTPTSGNIELYGSGKLDQERRKIGSVIEAPALYDNMTAKQNLDIFSALLPDKPRFDMVKVLDIVGLNNVERKKVKQYSLGMKQRLGIAIALLGSPEFLILDEPINGLDPIGIKEFREIIVNLNREYGLTILISSHILGELFKLVTCYGVIAEGKIVAELRNEDFDQLGIKSEGREAYLIGLMEGSKDGEITEI